MSLIVQFSIVIVLGAFGGLLHHIRYHKGDLVIPQKVVNPETKRVSFFMGFVGHMLYGIGAALIAFLTLNSSLDAVYRVFGVAFGAGFVGHSYLAKTANQTLQTRKEERNKALPDVQTEEVDEKGNDK